VEPMLGYCVSPSGSGSNRVDSFAEIAPLLCF